MSFTFPPDQQPLRGSVAPMGSLDIWLIAKGHMRIDGTVEMTIDLLDQVQKKSLNT